MVANRMLTNLYAIVGYEAAMGSLQQTHDAVERAVVIRSYTDGSRSRSAADAELERIGVKVASQLPPLPLRRPSSGPAPQLKPRQAPRRFNDGMAGLARPNKQKGRPR
jgi:hypothetical protein